MQQRTRILIVALLICVFQTTRPSNCLRLPAQRPKPQAPTNSTITTRLSTSTSPPAQNLRVHEESHVGTLVANFSVLMSSIQSRGSAVTPMSLTLLQEVPYFAIDATGALVVASRIDREDPALCPQLPPLPPPPPKVSTNAIDTSTPTCTLLVSVLLQKSNAQSGSSRPVSVSVPVTVLDVDDNVPQFPVPHLYASVAENAPIGSVVLRPPLARDADASAAHRTQVEYTLVGPDAYYFVLVHLHNTSRESLEMHIAKDIDRERLVNRTLSAQIRAFPKIKDNRPLPLGDAEREPLSAVDVSVTVFDVNEFDPEFVDAPAEPIHLPENTETGTEVWQLQAIDADAEGGSIEYRLGALASDSARRAFRLESATGRLLVASSQELDFERTREFILPVEAIDSGVVGITPNSPNTLFSRDVPAFAPFRRTATATIHIVLDNLNDNHPVVTLSIPSISSSSTASDLESKSDGQTLAISEAIPIGTYLAAITVSDADEMNGTGIECELHVDESDKHIFHLDRLESGMIHWLFYYFPSKISFIVKHFVSI